MYLLLVLFLSCIYSSFLFFIDEQFLPKIFFYFDDIKTQLYAKRFDVSIDSNLVWILFKPCQKFDKIVPIFVYVWICYWYLITLNELQSATDT